MEDEIDPDDTATRQQHISSKEVPPGVVVYSIDGPFFFGAAERYQKAIARTKGLPKVVILRMRNVPYMDSTGLSALGEVVRRFQKGGTLVILSAVQREPRATEPAREPWVVQETREYLHMSKEKPGDDPRRQTDWKNTKQSDEPWKGPPEKEQKPGKEKPDLEKWHDTKTH